uniref:Alpha/beta-hydrolase n=1 Tax=Strongyloides papillosus TaxID=174720 RepID=A0A0N5BZ82_STREA
MKNNTTLEDPFFEYNNHGGLKITNVRNHSQVTRTSNGTGNDSSARRHNITTTTELIMLSRTTKTVKNISDEQSNRSTSEVIPISSATINPTTKTSQDEGSQPTVDSNDYESGTMEKYDDIKETENKNAIIISVVGGFLLLLVIIFLIICFCGRFKKRSKKSRKGKKKSKKKSNKHRSGKSKRKGKSRSKRREKSPLLNNIPDNGNIKNIGYNVPPNQIPTPQRNVYPVPGGNPSPVSQNNNINVPENQGVPPQHNLWYPNRIENNLQIPVHPAINYPPIEASNVQPLLKSSTDPNGIPLYGNYLNDKEGKTNKCTCKNGAAPSQVIYLSHGVDNWMKGEEKDSLSCFSFQISSSHSIKDRTR